MIKRSAGIPVVVGSIPYVVGGGYEGSTKELDDIVKQEAELLAKAFHKDIEIRFNSDRESGGAWLANSLKGFDGNCQVGLTAGLRRIHPEDMTDEEFHKLWRTIQPTKLYIATYVSASALKNPELANSGNPDSRYCWLAHNTVEDAIAWLKTNVDTKKIYK